MDRGKLLESLYDPNALISPGYAMASVTLEDGSMLMGRITEESDASLRITALNGTTTDLPRTSVASMSPPVSAMPPIAATLPPRDLRDLTAYLATLDGSQSRPGRDAAPHGESTAK